MGMNWIPTDFSLPAKDGKYIVTQIFGGYNVTDCVKYDSKRQEWHTPLKVTAWLPLPEPYKEE